MKNYYSLAMLVLVSYFMLGMSSPADVGIKSSGDIQNTAQSSKGYAKPHAGIDLQYKLPKYIQVDESIGIELIFKVRVQAVQLSVKVVLDDGLQLNTQSEYEFETYEYKKNTIILGVTALQEGRHLINLSATILVDGQYQSRSFIIPVIVGDPVKSKSNIQAIENSGYKVDKAHGVVSMPAVESSN